MRIGGRWTGTFNLLKLRVGQILPFRTTTAANFPTLVLYCLGKDWRQSSCISMETWSQQDASIPVQCCTNTSSLLLVLKPAQYLYCTQWITLYKKKVTGYSHGYGSLEHSCLVTECRESSKSEKKKKTNLLEDSSCAISSSAVISARAWTLPQQCSSHWLLLSHQLSS